MSPSLHCSLSAHYINIFSQHTFFLLLRLWRVLRFSFPFHLVRSQRPTILTEVFPGFFSVTPGKYRHVTFNVDPGRHLPKSFSLPYPVLSLRCLKGINKIKFQFHFQHFTQFTECCWVSKGGLGKARVYTFSSCGMRITFQNKKKYLFFFLYLFNISYTWRV